MAFRIEFTEQAFQDFMGIIDYINDTLHNPQAAERFFATVNAKMKLIQAQPLMFPLHHDQKLKAKGYRFIAIGNYLIFYHVNEDRRLIHIARMLYGKRDITALNDDVTP